MSKLKWVFFDLGWTLVDESTAHRVRLERVSHALEEIGHQFTVDALVRLCEEASTEFAPSPFLGMLERLGLSDSQMVHLREVGRYANESEKLYPGVLDLLRRLSPEYELGIIANQSDGTERRLLEWGIRDRFSLVLASAEYGLSKPDARVFESALAEADCTAKQVVMVGDRLDHDIGPAKLQGWHTIRLLQGFSRFQKPRSTEEVPDLELASIREMPADGTLQPVLTRG